MFHYLSSCETIRFNNWDVSKVTSLLSIFSGTYKLVNIEGSIHGISVDISLGNSPLLTPESAMVIINGLKEGAKTSAGKPCTLTLNRLTYEKMTEEQLNVARDKGWEVISYG